MKLEKSDRERIKGAINYLDDLSDFLYWWGYEEKNNESKRYNTLKSLENATTNLMDNFEKFLEENA